mmetsp:Transcript_36251/g.80685  ORF Transcript_36251/g.80685 Transcript_36251/m.80685 type:complete len:493 (+) Transcript_36251:452-1930(+)|eukprot:CAMPEP_0202904716 /NCGR_PEP_ID=MMETSP1392-20130828/30797_1 /ASSEMBLY_ACC=CAM_ASM_000868 /TAXON_ID=225041 /ORGANISM="Chlamydomonas chlamydogama, Strain SAG 11-48b" /LENGTH=492 /DNA_ID=CAMNT_0049592499 /DNA_START=369 /DNA_END=1847 /DNA_ORIENTATION=-
MKHKKKVGKPVVPASAQHTVGQNGRDGTSDQAHMTKPHAAGHAAHAANGHGHELLANGKARVQHGKGGVNTNKGGNRSPLGKRPAAGQAQHRAPEEQGRAQHAKRLKTAAGSMQGGHNPGVRAQAQDVSKAGQADVPASRPTAAAGHDNGLDHEGKTGMPRQAAKKGKVFKNGKSATAAAGTGTTAPAAAAAAPPSKTTPVGSNWESLKKVIGARGQGRKRKEGAEGQSAGGAGMKRPSSLGKNQGVTQVIAMDCEMVGVGPNGVRSAVARVCLVNNEGNVLLDAHVSPKEPVTDFRTRYSGIRPADLQGPGVLSLEEAQEKVSKLLTGCTLVGHALHNDLKALLLDHPRKDRRDTATYPPLMKAPAPGRKMKARALRHLAKEELGLTIQEGEHSPVDDARAALYIYHRHRKDWERALATGSLKRAKVHAEANRKALNSQQLASAETGGDARKARMGRGGGSHAAAALLKAKAHAKVDFMSRDVRDDPLADL